MKALVTAAFFSLVLPVGIFLSSCGTDPFNPNSSGTAKITVTKTGANGEPAGYINGSRFDINLLLRNDANLDASFLVLEFSFKFSTSTGKYYKKVDYNKYLKQGDQGSFKTSIYESEFSGQTFSKLTLVRLETIEFWNTQQDAAAAIDINEYTGQAGVIYE
ncbi:MAG: hypothetical protein JNM63_00765 [Spirochaetia bacterium]|nr:hypothetical protein [Spirochaetia bacterium]